MVDITHKYNSLRTAIAEAKVTVSKPETIEAVKKGEVPKGDIFEMSRAAGLLGIKKTAELLPDCHPLPIEHAKIDYNINGQEILIQVLVKTIYKTGVEVEAMHGASIVALNIYDMLKPIDKGVEIQNIRLLEKTGGKSGVKSIEDNIKAAVVVCSDSIHQKQNTDKAGKAAIELLEEWGVEITSYEVIPDETSEIQKIARESVEKKLSLLIYTGGTGLSPRDNTPEALKSLIDRPVPGIEEAMRSYGQQRTPFAMLSRSMAGMMGDTLVLALPGSTNGVRDCLQAIFPAVLHVFHIIKGGGH